MGAPASRLGGVALPPEAGLAYTTLAYVTSKINALVSGMACFIFPPYVNPDLHDYSRAFLRTLALQRCVHVMAQSHRAKRGMREGASKAGATLGSSCSLRAPAATSVAPATGLEVDGGVLLNFGTVVDPYLGLGAGVAAFDSARMGVERAFGYRTAQPTVFRLYQVPVQARRRVLSRRR